MAGSAFHLVKIASSRPGVRVSGRQTGFTLVELIVVMIVIGILGSIASVKFFDRGGFDSNAFVEQTRAMLRFSQKLAIAQNRAVFTQLNGSTIALCFASTSPCPGGSMVPAIAGNSSAAACSPSNWYCAAPPGTIAYAVTPSSASTICFTPLGQPGVPSGTGCTTTGFTGATVNITGDGTTKPVNIAAETGYVF
jgi:MSHA pilin protein MshC